MKSISGVLDPVLKTSISQNNTINFNTIEDLTQQSGLQVPYIPSSANISTDTAIQLAGLSEPESIKDILSDEIKEDIENVMNNMDAILHQHQDLFEEIISLCVHLGRERDEEFICISDIRDIIQAHYPLYYNIEDMSKLLECTKTLVDHLYFNSNISKKCIRSDIDILSSRKQIENYINYYIQQIF